MSQNPHNGGTKKRHREATVYDAVAGEPPLCDTFSTLADDPKRALLNQPFHPLNPLHLPHTGCPQLEHSAYPTRRSPLPPSRRAGT